ncbi:MAG: tetraprenyl-beta-curcumene synthase family protein [Bacillota bacterium]
MTESYHQSKTIYRFVKNIFPIVEENLNHWKIKASMIPDRILSEQALSSIEKKAFHAQGGAVYGLYHDRNQHDLIQLIVALQTISDYLDNLCDRVGIEDEKAFLQLHLAITDALYLEDHFSDYYRYYPLKEDGLYLYELVNTCKVCIHKLPSYHKVQDKAQWLGTLYSEMQSFKHISPAKREVKLHVWAKPYLQQYNHLSTWEFAAAAGSTLGIFMLCSLAIDENLIEEEVHQVMDAYFPWVCGLHILLDYFIDQREDSLTGDLNFVSYYQDIAEQEKKLKSFLQESIERIVILKNPLFHLTVIEGLLAMYLSDPKTKLEPENMISHKLLTSSPKYTSFLYNICKLLRKKQILH